MCAYIPRNPDSRATEKKVQSSLNDAERTNGPVFESSIGRVFILGVGKEYCTWRTRGVMQLFKWGCLDAQLGGISKKESAVRELAQQTAQKALSGNVDAYQAHILSSD